MLFCTNCGEKIIENASFCQNCGEKLSEDNTNLSVPTRDSLKVGGNESQHQSTKVKGALNQSSQLNNNKTPMSLMGKVVLSLIIGIVALLFGTKYFLNQKFDPEKQLKEMHAAFIEEDYKKFYSYFEFPEGTIGGEERFYNWIKEAGWKNVRDEISNEIENFKDGKAMDPINIYYEDALRLKEENVLFGLGKTITYTIRPLELTVVANLDNTIITVDGKEFEINSEEKEIGKFIFGTYNSSYIVKGPYMELTGEQEFSVYPSDYNNTAYNFYEIDYGEAELYSSRSDAIVYINGESTGKTVSELEYISPIAFESDVMVYLVDKDEDGNEIKSDEHYLANDTIYFEFEYEQELELKDSLKDHYEIFREQFMMANNYADFDYISDFFDSDSQIYVDYKKFVDDHKHLDHHWYYPISNEVTKIEKISDTEYHLYATEEFELETKEETVNYVHEKLYKYLILEDETVVIADVKDLNTK